MDAKMCFILNCKHQAEYECICTFPTTYLCSEHLEQHTKLSNKNHALSALFSIPPDDSKNTILRFLENEILSMTNLKIELMASLNNHLCDLIQRIQEILKKTDYEIQKLNDYYGIISKIQKISKFDQDPLIRALSLDPDKAVLRAKDIISKSRDSISGIKEIFREGEILNKMIKYFVENSIKNFQDKTLEIENMLKNCKFAISGKRLVELKKSIKDLIENINTNKDELAKWAGDIEIEGKNENFNIYSIDQYLNEKLNLKKTALSSKNKLKISIPLRSASLNNSSNIEEERKHILFFDNYDYYSNLIIYDPENRIEEKKELALDEYGYDICTTNLPNGELFCLYKYSNDTFAYIIDSDYEARYLSSKEFLPYSSALYFNSFIYCFWCSEVNRFDLNNNQWSKLVSMPVEEPYNYYCSVIFNGNILISGNLSTNLFLYSIEIDSFSKIPWYFKKDSMKILINLEDQLYLIECRGFIYESDVANYTTWNLISESPIRSSFDSVSYAYNKGELYIGCMLKACEELGRNTKCRYYKFSLDMPIPIRIK